MYSLDDSLILHLSQENVEHAAYLAGCLVAFLGRLGSTRHCLSTEALNIVFWKFIFVLISLQDNFTFANVLLPAHTIDLKRAIVHPGVIVVYDR